MLEILLIIGAIKVVKEWRRFDAEWKEEEIRQKEFKEQWKKDWDRIHCIDVEVKEAD